MLLQVVGYDVSSLFYLHNQLIHCNTMLGPVKARERTTTECHTVLKTSAIIRKQSALID